MGLNVTAYGKLKRISEDEVQFGSYGLPINDRIKSFFANPDYPYHMSGINPNAFYLCKGELFAFRAGSYAGFNEWKNQLAQLAGFKNSQDYWNNKPVAPFSELINFSDSEGAIGYVVASKLAKDFQDYENLAKNSNIPFFYESYKNWKRACEIASKDGVINFH